MSQVPLCKFPSTQAVRLKSSVITRFVSFNITSAFEIVVTSVSGGVEFLNHEFGHGAQLEHLVKNSDEAYRK